MSDKIIFREMLSEIAQVAQTKGNQLTIEEIKEFFQAVSLNEEQMELVYSYLEANKISIKGHVKSDAVKMFESKEEEIEDTKEETTKESDASILDTQDNKYLAMYLEELNTLQPMSQEEKNTLFHNIIQNDPVAKSRFIEIYLPKVVELAKGYVNKGVALSDLIQEGNIGLMLTLDSINKASDVTQIEVIVEAGVRQALEEALEEADSVRMAGKQIAGRANYLNEGVKNLEEELGRTASVEELARYMEMSVQEVMDIIRVSDDEIIVRENENNKKE